MTMNLETFLSQFSTPSHAIDYILKAHDDGRVETIQYTIPYYTYARCLQTPRFIAYGIQAPQRHSIEVRIAPLEGNDNDSEIVIEFPVMCWMSTEWFAKHLANQLSDELGEFESEQLSLTDPDDIECYALDLQRELNLRRIFDIRKFITETDSRYVTFEQFERNCRDVANLLDVNDAITARIRKLNNL